MDPTSSFETGHLTLLTTLVVEEGQYERELVAMNHCPRYLESNMRSMLEALVEAQ